MAALKEIKRKDLLVLFEGDVFSKKADMNITQQDDSSGIIVILVGITQDKRRVFIS